MEARLSYGSTLNSEIAGVERSIARRLKMAGQKMKATKRWKGGTIRECDTDSEERVIRV